MSIINSHAMAYIADNTTQTVNANAHWETTITAPHAMKGDMCNASHSEYPADHDLFATAYVATTSVIHWVAHNPTPGNLTLGHGTMRVHIWKDDL